MDEWPGGRRVAENREDWLFDLLVELCDHTHERGMSEVSQRLEDALDALIAWEAGEGVVPFRSVRHGHPPRIAGPIPRERRLTLAR